MKRWCLGEGAVVPDHSAKIVNCACRVASSFYRAQCGSSDEAPVASSQEEEYAQSR